MGGMWKGRSRKIVITDTKVVELPKKKTASLKVPADYEEFNDPFDRSSRRKLSADEANTFRGRLKQKMRSPQNLKTHNFMRNRAVEEYKKEDPIRPRDLL